MPTNRGRCRLGYTRFVTRPVTTVTSGWAACCPAWQLTLSSDSDGAVTVTVTAPRSTGGTTAGTCSRILCWISQYIVISLMLHSLISRRLFCVDFESIVDRDLYLSLPLSLYMYIIRGDFKLSFCSCHRCVDWFVYYAGCWCQIEASPWRPPFLLHGNHHALSSAIFSCAFADAMG